MADGVILLVGTDPHTISRALDIVAEGAREGGRRLEDLHTVLWAPTAIREDGVSARDLIRPHVASAVMQKLKFELPAEDMTTVETIRAAYNYYEHMVPGSAQARLVTDALVDRFSLAGTPQECRDKFDAVAETGIRQVSIIPFVAPGEDRSATMEGFAAIHPEATQG